MKKFKIGTTLFSAVCCLFVLSSFLIFGFVSRNTTLYTVLFVAGFVLSILRVVPTMAIVLTTKRLDHQDAGKLNSLKETATDFLKYQVNDLRWFIPTFIVLVILNAMFVHI